MNENTMRELELAGIDIDSAVERFMGESALYQSFLFRFPQDKSFGKLEAAVQQENWHDAAELAHAMKGVAANLSLTKLTLTCADMVVAGRSGDVELMKALYPDICAEYERMCTIIRRVAENAN